MQTLVEHTPQRASVLFQPNRVLVRTNVYLTRVYARATTLPHCLFREPFLCFLFLPVQDIG